MPRAIELQPYAWSGPYARMRSASSADHDPGLCASVSVPWMDADERLIIRSSEIVGYPEAYLYDDHLPPAEPEGRGKDYQHHSFQWDASRSPEQLSADCTVEGRGRFTLDLQARDDYVDIGLSVRNDMAQPMGPMEWHFCVIAFDCPSLADPELDRTFLYTGRRLRSLRELSGSNRCGIYTVAGADGFVPESHQILPRGPVEAQASVVIVEDVSGQHSVALGFDRSYNIFSNSGNRCFHAEPYFGILSGQGDERRRRGRLYLMERNADDALQRYWRDFQGKEP